MTKIKKEVKEETKEEFTDKINARIIDLKKGLQTQETRLKQFQDAQKMCESQIIAHRSVITELTTLINKNKENGKTKNN